jgi:hypothetical protein
VNAVDKVMKEPNYIQYRMWRKILLKVRELLQASGIDLSKGGTTDILTPSITE